MKTVYDNWAFWQRLLNMLENEFGNRCELILHDLTKDYAHTVVDIRNGHITGRKIGDCGSNLGLEVLRGEVKDGDRYNYVVHTPDGKILRSSTMFLYDDDGKVIGSLGIELYDEKKLPEFQELADFKYPEYSVKKTIRPLYAPDRALTKAPEIPVPYRTFAETFSYGI